MKMISVRCENEGCDKTFQKRKAEHNRSVRLGRKAYCCLSCYAKASGINNLKNTSPEVAARNKQEIGLYSDNRRDKYTPFRFFTHVIRNSRKGKEMNLTEEYLLRVWEEQKGICPFTGWLMLLPDTTNGWKEGWSVRSASLDRIDNAKGYIEGNVRFVASMANIGRNKFSDGELIEFCLAVSEKMKKVSP